MKNLWKRIVSCINVTIGSALGVTVVCALIIAYSALGFALVFPYAALAGAQLNDLTPWVPFAPVIALVLGFMATALFQHHHPLIRTWLRTGFCLIVAYLCLPILFNGISLGMKAYGWETAATVVFVLRFWSLLLVPVLAIVAMVVYEKLPATHRIRWTRKPPSSPPSSGNDVNRRRSRDDGNDQHVLRLAITS